MNIDHNISAATDYVGDITNLPVRAGSVERIETYHVIEHIPRPFVIETLTRWFHWLEKGGVLVIECPDLKKDCEEYLAGNEDRLRSIFGPQRFPGDTHFWGYTTDSLVSLLTTVGFNRVICCDPQDYHKDAEPCIRVEAIK